MGRNRRRGGLGACRPRCAHALYDLSWHHGHGLPRHSVVKRGLSLKFHPAFTIVTTKLLPKQGLILPISGAEKIRETGLMKRLWIATATAAFAVSGTSALAQDGETPEVEDVEVESVEDAGKPMEPTANGNGASVVRTETVLTEDTTEIDPETGELLKDENGETVQVEVGTQYQQTVTTPSGNVNTLTKTWDLDGNQTVSVDHTRPERPERAAKLDKPDRPDKPDKPGKPEGAGRP